jgi:AcrR family transcriptional regulator
MHTQTASKSNPGPVNSPTTSTRDRLLDVAERLFAQRGVDATSLRAITTAAEANLASVNYHFGSKDGLFLEILARRTAPVNAERLRLLSLAEKQADGHPSTGAILHAFLAPALRMYARDREDAKHIISLLGRLHTEPRADELKRLFFNELREVMQRFIPALQQALPQLEAHEVARNFFFTVGSMAHLMSAGDMLSIASDGLCNADDSEANLQHLIAFSAAGMSASPTRNTI